MKLTTIQLSLFTQKSLIELRAVLFQSNEENKMKVISFNFLIQNPQEQNISTPELLGIVHALQIYEFLIIGSPHPMHVFTDHKPLLNCFTKKNKLTPTLLPSSNAVNKVFKTKNFSHTWKKSLGCRYAVKVVITNKSIETQTTSSTN